jgi:hypothetical protein
MSKLFAYCGATVGKATRRYLPNGHVTNLAMPKPEALHRAVGAPR